MGRESQAHVKTIMLAPCGNSGDVIFAVQFDRKVELAGASEYGFPLTRRDVEELYRQLGIILRKNRIISLGKSTLVR